MRLDRTPSKVMFCALNGGWSYGETPLIDYEAVAAELRPSTVAAFDARGGTLRRQAYLAGRKVIPGTHG